ncbi:TetR/AcrR family transcriptional regulator [Rhodococcus sp. ACPA4]|uniref:TetR family transcriptional regulator n=2 Tax=Nocardiaceae TaxID=85025 RepID=A0A652YY09_NOCGL|nr:MULTISPECIES: TetR/AcrR family transcriptional regulator [Rhodococcus]NMD59040.1 helix-turn-helix transcriptional regulator [Nocardia globerula]NRI66029.1 helix-turn-helix transcriptional regulator [Rhodococcus sp. MS16]KJF20019.1 transcriptional regulator BetI [Rhodococcus sp. AD45]MCE4266879.1 helix-turn-helix transcriptional regulator [Rhodococcus globerulus]MDV6267305.1 helix-turn-helix domain-containing protein [Rhodococcus globerulus]
MSAIPLPQIGAQPAERGDAARNRALLLDAAALLVAERGVDAVTMDAVACRAGVGKGTVFRRFGSRAGLMQALLDHTERELQHAFMFGPPPLGPGAPPIDRLVAFGRARIAMVEVQGDVLRAAENAPEFRFGGPARSLSIAHVISLLRTAGVEGDLELLASALLAPLEASLVLYQVRDLGMTTERLADGWENLARRVTRC